jgi:hypothetical protein
MTWLPRRISTELFFIDSKKQDEGGCCVPPSSFIDNSVIESRKEEVQDNEAPDGSCK